MERDFTPTEATKAQKILNGAVSIFNSTRLYRPFVRDPDLADILDRQMEFQTREWEGMSRHFSRSWNRNAPGRQESGDDTSRNYGADVARNPGRDEGQGIRDDDIARSLMALHKCSATSRLRAALDSGEGSPQEVFLQGARDCAEQAFELSAYLSRKGRTFAAEDVRTERRTAGQYVRTPAGSDGERSESVESRDRPGSDQQGDGAGDEE